MLLYVSDVTLLLTSLLFMCIMIFSLDYHIIPYTAKLLRGENFCGFHGFLANCESFPLESLAVYST